MKRTDVSTEDLIAGYRKGLTIRTLAEKFDMSYTAIHRRLKTAGVDLRPAGIRPSYTPRLRGFDLLARSLMGARRDAGMSQATMGLAMGVSRVFVVKLEANFAAGRLGAVLAYAEALGMRLALVADDAESVDPHADAEQVEDQEHRENTEEDGQPSGDPSHPSLLSS